MTFPQRPFPEIPYPYPPGREPPRRTEPVVVPLVEMPVADPRIRWFEQRIVMATGALDHASVTQLSAELMTLDGASAQDVRLVVNSPGGPTDEVFALLDVIALMRAKVDTACVGSARGTAAALVACGTGRRTASPNAVLSLRCEEQETLSGSPDDVRRRADEIATTRQRLAAIVAEATGRPAAEIADELDLGDTLDAEAAVRLGVIDAVTPAPERDET